MSNGSERIPLVDLAIQHATVRAEVERGWAKVLQHTSFIHGNEVADFERAFAAFIGAPHCVGVANGTDALEMVLRALDIGPGDKVALPANTFIASAFAVLRTGARPLLVDVDEACLLMDPASLADRLTSDCRVVMPVHLFGQLAPMRALREVSGDRPLLEDGAQAHGACQDGRGMATLGIGAATSFYPGKNLGAYGDAGAVLTHDVRLADRVRLLGNHGSIDRYEHPETGFNSRLDTLQAVVLTAKLRHLEQWNAERRAAAARYATLLGELEGVCLPATADGNEHVWHLYTVRIERRDEVLKALNAGGIGAAVHYPKALHEQGALRDLGHDAGEFPIAERAARTLLSLPLYPGIAELQQQRVADELGKALR